MRTAVAAAAALWIGLVAPAGAAESVTASRAYKLCLIEDPSCASLVLTAHRRVLDEERRRSIPQRRFCPEAIQTDPHEVLRTFMYVARQAPPGLIYLPIDDYLRNGMLGAWCAGYPQAAAAAEQRRRGAEEAERAINRPPPVPDMTIGD